jgi:hypothetical protein
MQILLQAIMMPSSRIPNSSETITVVNILYNNDQ